MFYNEEWKVLYFLFIESVLGSGKKKEKTVPSLVQLLETFTDVSAILQRFFFDSAAILTIIFMFLEIFQKIAFEKYSNAKSVITYTACIIITYLKETKDQMAYIVSLR